MADQGTHSSVGRQAVASAEPKADVRGGGAAALSCRPRVKVFGTDVGGFECALQGHTTTIGRSDDADIVLPNMSVSRNHARIIHSEDQFTLEDVGSTSGTTVNGVSIKSRVLEHEDSIEIATYILQFRTREVVSGAESAAARAKMLLRGAYCTPPSSMKVRVRTLGRDISSMFEAGETLRVGQGGLLIPTSTPPEDGSSLELEMAITKRVTRHLLGDVMGVIEEDGVHWMCIKLHTMPTKELEAIVAGAEPGPWMDVAPT